MCASSLSHQTIAQVSSAVKKESTTKMHRRRIMYIWRPRSPQIAWLQYYITLHWRRIMYWTDHRRPPDDGFGSDNEDDRTFTSQAYKSDAKGGKGNKKTARGGGTKKNHLTKRRKTQFRRTSVNVARRGSSKRKYPQNLLRSTKTIIPWRVLKRRSKKRVHHPHLWLHRLLVLLFLRSLCRHLFSLTFLMKSRTPTPTQHQSWKWSIMNTTTMVLMYLFWRVYEALPCSLRNNGRPRLLLRMPSQLISSKISDSTALLTLVWPKKGQSQRTLSSFTPLSSNGFSRNMNQKRWGCWTNCWPNTKVGRSFGAKVICAIQ